MRSKLIDFKISTPSIFEATAEVITFSKHDNKDLDRAKIALNSLEKYQAIQITRFTAEILNRFVNHRQKSYQYGEIRNIKIMQALDVLRDNLPTLERIPDPERQMQFICRILLPSLQDIRVKTNNFQSWHRLLDIIETNARYYGINQNSYAAQI